MVHSTRRTKFVPPSSLASKMLKFATTRTINPYFNGWLQFASDKIYVRKGVDRRFHLANWNFKKRGHKHATRILEFFETIVKTNDFPYIGLKVETVLNHRFAAFFRTRKGWVEDGETPPSFVFDA